MEPIDEGVAPTPARNKRSWLMTAAVATGLAVGAAGLAGAATGGSSGSSSTTAPSGVVRLRPGTDRSAPERATARRCAGPGVDAERSRRDAAHRRRGHQGQGRGARRGSGRHGDPRRDRLGGDATYEAHLKKSDGTEVTVLMDANFTVTSTVDGFGGGPAVRAVRACVAARAHRTARPSSSSEPVDHLRRTSPRRPGPVELRLGGAVSRPDVVTCGSRVRAARVTASTRTSSDAERSRADRGASCPDVRGGSGREGEADDRAAVGRVAGGHGAAVALHHLGHDREPEARSRSRCGRRRRGRSGRRPAPGRPRGCRPRGRAPRPCRPRPVTSIAPAPYLIALSSRFDTARAERAGPPAHDGGRVVVQQQRAVGAQAGGVDRGRRRAPPSATGSIGSWSASGSRASVTSSDTRSVSSCTSKRMPSDTWRRWSSVRRSARASSSALVWRLVSGVRSSWLASAMRRC